MKVVNTREYVSVLRELTEEGQVVSMQIAGSSMSPFLIHNRDIICFRKPEPDRRLQKGDMVFYQRISGQYVMQAKENSGMFIWKPMGNQACKLEISI